VEFVFYHALNSVSGYFAGGIDVFRETRRQALDAALALPEAPPRGSATGEPMLRDRIAHALWMALLGNEIDYSQLVVGGSRMPEWQGRLVIDDSAELLNVAASATSAAGTFHIIVDNAGSELLADLALADAFLSIGDETCVVLHCKPWPMFVSDALVEDAQGSIDGLMTHASTVLRGLGRRLEVAVTAARLRFERHPAWGEPRHFDALDAELVQALQRGAMVLSKGDLNYRRFVGDRDWPVETPARLATAGVPFGAFALRVLKSDAVVGVPVAFAAEAALTSPTWRTDASHALVQRLGMTS
jgi:uncharacterized protein with ATP-grasp and redox domains